MTQALYAHMNNKRKKKGNRTSILSAVQRKQSNRHSKVRIKDYLGLILMSLVVPRDSPRVSIVGFLI
jgi:hypothetical protein